MHPGCQIDGKQIRINLSAINTHKSDIVEEASNALQSGTAQKVTYSIEPNNDWTTRELAAIKAIDAVAEENGVTSDYEKLPAGALKILKLSSRPTATAAKDQGERFDLLEFVGVNAITTVKNAKDTLNFVAAAFQSVHRLLAGKAQYRQSDLISFIRAAGAQALPIVGLVNILLGVILAFMGAIQLQQFGAEIYVANLVALGQTREIAPMMTAIILAGRTGAAYAAQLGTMQVNEEIDALKTFGFSPMDFLVLPRMTALAVMTPLLVLYADAIGIFGGYLIGMSLLGIGAVEYVVQTQNAIGLGDIALGVFKGSIFGVLVAITGCMQGMRSGRSASAVGDAATSAVVGGIVAIIVATAIFAVLTNALGI